MALPPLMHLRIFLPFALGYFLSYLFRTVNAVLAPDLARDLGLEPGRLGLLTAAYLLAFAAAQPPLGILLDRYGPRRVEAILLLFAAVGALLFARAATFAELLLGRALIGVGVAACLMAAFKAFTIWFPPDRLPLANGIQMVSGGLGALAATTPVALVLPLTGWRGLFLVLAAATLLVAAAVFVIVPERPGGGDGRESLGQQLAGVGAIFASRVFWQITPWAVTAQAAYLALVGLWAGPWLRDVAGCERLMVANTLLGISLAMILGYVGFGTLAAALGRRGVPTARVAAAGMTAFLGVQVLLLLQPVGLAVPLWLLFGFFGTACILPYAVLSQQFPPQLAGRVNTALNLLVFVAAFAAQWGVGAMVGLWPESSTGNYAAAGYAWGFGLLAVLQGLAAFWFRFSAGKGC